MSDEVKLLVVSYLMDGVFHATLHVSTCGILKRVQRQETPDPRFPGQSVLEPEKYARRPGAEARPPKHHTCVAKYLEGSAEALQSAMI